MNTIYDAKILIVDDNADLLALLCEQLRGAGYGKIRTAQSCGGARAAFAAGQPELMILDINLPDGDGFSLFRALRAKADVPALFLSARDADADRLFGLGLGADDYLTKPFLMQELLLRVQHILQRAYRAELSAAKPTVLQLGPRSVDLNDAVVSLPDGKTLALTATELALLRKLAENRGHIVTYDAICDAVWGADYYGYENSLGVHIRHLREKLERVNQADDQNVENRRCEKRQRDFPEARPSARAVNFCGFIIGSVDANHTGQKNQAKEAHVFPYGHQHDCGHRPFFVQQPAGALNPKESKDVVHSTVLRGQNAFPNQRCRDPRGQDRNIVQHTEHTDAAPLLRQKRCNSQ